MNKTIEDKDVCRICLEKKSLLLPLLKKRGDGFSPYEKLVRCLNIKLELTGSTSICWQCQSELDITTNFLDKCEQANQHFISTKSSDQLENLKSVSFDEEDDFVVKNDFKNEDYADQKQGLIRSLLVSELLQCGECGSRRRCPHWTPPTQFKCEHCNNCFNKKSNFILHLKRHLGEREHSCPRCGAQFVMRSQALRHCLPKPRHPCPMQGCGKSFTTNTNLRTHLHMHNGDRPYQCPVCGKQFACKNTLNDHKRIHTGEKPYICAVCGKSFTTNKLSCHMRTHTGARPHVCPWPDCGRTFPSARALARHACVHHAVDTRHTHACALCPARYNHTQSLNKHMRKAHGQKPKTPGSNIATHTLSTRDED